jgi:hypothetical protein
MKHSPADMGTPEYQRISISPTCVKPACFADSSGMLWSVNDNNMLHEAHQHSTNVFTADTCMLLAALLMLCVCASTTCDTTDKICTWIFCKHTTEPEKQQGSNLSAVLELLPRLDWASYRTPSLTNMQHDGVRGP